MKAISPLRYGWACIAAKLLTLHSRIVSLFRDCSVLGLCPSFGIVKNPAFRKLDLFPSPGERVGGAYSVVSVTGSRCVKGKVKLSLGLIN
jgi:hypothetical protein